MQTTALDQRLQNDKPQAKIRLQIGLSLFFLWRGLSTQSLKNILSQHLRLGRFHRHTELTDLSEKMGSWAA